MKFVRLIKSCRLKKKKKKKKNAEKPNVDANNRLKGQVANNRLRVDSVVNQKKKKKNLISPTPRNPRSIINSYFSQIVLHQRLDRAEQIEEL